MQTPAMRKRSNPNKYLYKKANSSEICSYAVIKCQKNCYAALWVCQWPACRISTLAGGQMWCPPLDNRARCQPNHGLCFRPKEVCIEILPFRNWPTRRVEPSVWSEGLHHWGQHIDQVCKEVLGKNLLPFIPVWIQSYKQSVSLFFTSRMISPVRSL